MPDARCRLCGGAAHFLYSARLLGNHDVAYFDCAQCGYVQTEQPYWLDEAYREPINATDTGIVRRNSVNARIVQATLLALPSSSDVVVDFAGGYGLLVRMLRDAGVNALWRDAYCSNLFARGFEHRGEPASLATAFEVFEHFVDPLPEADAITRVAPTILLSTELMPDVAPEPGKWWYFGLDHGQHVGFFRARTLVFLAKKLNMRLISDGQSYHVLTRQNVTAERWRLLKRWNAFILLRNRFARRSLTQSDFENLLQRKDHPGDPWTTSS